MANVAAGRDGANLRQSMQSIFSGRTLGLTSNDVEGNSEGKSARRQGGPGDEETKNQESENDESDDDIERDETAEVIEPVRRRNASQSSQKKLIKVKLKAPPKRAPGDDTRASMTQSRLASMLEHAANRPDFEEKVKGQIDHKFIDTLIENVSKRSLAGSSSAWSGIAVDLRDKIKLKSDIRKLSGK